MEREKGGHSTMHLIQTNRSDHGADITAYPNQQTIMEQIVQLIQNNRSDYGASLA